MAFSRLVHWPEVAFVYTEYHGKTFTASLNLRECSDLYEILQQYIATSYNPFRVELAARLAGDIYVAISEDDNIELGSRAAIEELKPNGR